MFLFSKLQQFNAVENFEDKFLDLVLCNGTLIRSSLTPEDRFHPPLELSVYTTHH